MSELSNDVSFCRTWFFSASGRALLGWVRSQANRYLKGQESAAQKRALNLARIRADLNIIRHETLAMEDTMPIACPEGISPQGHWINLQNVDGGDDDLPTSPYQVKDLQRALSFRPEDGEMPAMDTLSAHPWEADTSICSTIDDYQCRHSGRLPTILVLGSWILGQLPVSMQTRYPYAHVEIPIISPPSLVETAILAFSPDDIPRTHTHFSFLRQHSIRKGEVHEQNRRWAG